MVVNSPVLPGRRSRASKLSPEKRREQLLRCGLKVFALRGIGSARHAEIAEEAGVAVPTVFSYFPTREVLVRDVLAEVDAFLTQALLSALDNGNSVFEKFLFVTRT
ncbi:MAG: TetR/AcrR family transcriptional regulator, partial [Rhodospirillales bacterium]